jgi:transcriptional regulator with XRE-family HTH domain
MHNNHLPNNLKFLRKKTGKSQADIALQVKKRGTAISSWENGLSEPSINDLLIIADYLGVNAGELIGVDIQNSTHWQNENPIKSDKKLDLTHDLKLDLIHQKKQSVNILEKVEDMVQIPITDISVAAGTGVFNSDYMENVAHFSFPNHLLKRGATYLSVRIRGASMAPTLQDGGYMAIRLIERTEWANIADERVFVVCDTEGKSYLKRIKNRFKKGFIVLMSDSPDKASYPNFNLQADEIQSIWEAEFYISAKMPNIHSQYYSRLAQLEDKVDDLLKLLPKIEQ